MTGSTGTGLALALASTAALNWAFLRQHGAVSQALPLSICRPVIDIVGSWRQMAEFDSIGQLARALRLFGLLRVRLHRGEPVCAIR